MPVPTEGTGVNYPAVPPFFPELPNCDGLVNPEQLGDLYRGLTAAPYSIQAGRSWTSSEPCCHRAFTNRRLSETGCSYYSHS